MLTKPTDPSLDYSHLFPGMIIIAIAIAGAIGVVVGKLI